MIKNQDKQLLIRTLNYLKPYSSRIILLSGCFIITTLTTFAQPLFLKYLTDIGMVEKKFKIIVLFSVALLLAFIVNQLCGLIQTKIFIDIHNGSLLTLYKQAFTKLLNLPIDYYNDKNNTEIVNKISNDVDELASIADQRLLYSIMCILQIISGLAGLTIINWKLTLIIIVTIPLKFIIVRMFSKKKSKVMNKMIKINSKFYAWFGDIIGGIREIKLWNMFEPKTVEFKQKQEEVLKVFKENTMLDKYNILIDTMFDIAVTCIIYILGGYMIISNSITIGGVFAFISYSSYVTGPISMILNINYSFARIKPSAIRLFDFFDLPDEEFRKACEKKKKKEVPKQKKPLLEVNQLEFYYDVNTPLLKNVSFSAGLNEKIGIIGPNGSGKTTIINLLLGFYQPVSGSIKINGLTIQEMGLTNLRNHFSVVNQDPYLFQDTIANNIDITGESSKKMIKIACQNSGLEEYINNLPQGYNHQIGKNGAKLSGGQKQKLAVARAFLKKAEIVILDEATSNFDVDSNAYLHKTITEKFSDKTVIFITHKYDELKYMDRIYELQDGVLRELNAVYMKELLNGGNINGYDTRNAEC